MSQPTGNCASCGAPVQFRWSSAVQTVCPFCRSILVRTDIDLKKVGEVADLPPDPSPICLLTEGMYKGKSFQVVGRIVYEWEAGGWNEWHLGFADGTSGWLSDAQLQYAVSFLAQNSGALPPQREAERGKPFTFQGVEYRVSTVTMARYKGVEGDLPFAFYDKDEMYFADLRTPGPQFATLDYSEEPPLLFLGEWVEFGDLKLKNLRQFEGWAAS
jgi:Domain of unknown function (DUF4178)